MKMTQPDPEGNASLAAKLADEAADTVANLVETHYTHKICINDADGVYDCDCSGYVEHLLARIALRHVALIRDSASNSRPLAADFYKFFAHLPTTGSNPTKGWLQIGTIAETNRGDIIAWTLDDSSTTGDTGHVFIVADTPIQINGASFAVKAYDSSALQHFEDSRGEGSDFKCGVGSGTFHIDVGADGTPTSFQFNEKASTYKVPIAIARIQGFSAG